jgi:RNA polymerase sigma factor (sigma-70 family)
MATAINIDYGILERFKEGDYHSFEHIYNQFYKPLYNYGCQFNIVKAYVHDSIQDLFIDLWNNRHKLDITYSLHAFIFKSLRYKIQHQIKKDQIGSKKMQDFIKDSFEITLEEKDLFETENDTIKELKKSILLLAPKQRELIYLIFYHKMTFEDASKVMDISKKTAYNQIYNALKNLKVSMGESNYISFFLLFL